MRNPLFKKANGFDTPDGKGKTHYTGFYPEAVGGGWNPQVDNDNLRGELSEQMGGYMAGTRGAGKVQDYIDGLYRGTQEPPTEPEGKKPQTGKWLNASKTATGEMSPEDVTREAYPAHFAIADALGGEVVPFDVYQGPVINTQYGRLYVNMEPEGGLATVWNEDNTNESNVFSLDDENGAVDAALSTIPDPPEPQPYGEWKRENDALRRKNPPKAKKRQVFRVGDRVNDGGKEGVIISPAQHQTSGEAWVIRYTDGTRETAPAEALQKLQDKKLRKVPQFSEEDKIRLHGIGVKGALKSVWDKAITAGMLEFSANHYSFTKNASPVARRALKDTVLRINCALNRKHIPKNASAHEAAVKEIAKLVTSSNRNLDKMGSLAKKAAKATHVVYANSGVVRVMRGSDTIEEYNGSSKSAAVEAKRLAADYGIPEGKIRQASAKPKCPQCGSSKYALMPTDFETAKCDDCGKNWEHGIVDGINNPKDASWEDGQWNEDCPLPERERCNTDDAETCCGGGFAYNDKREWVGAPCPCKVCHPPVMGIDHPHAKFLQKRFEHVSSEKIATTKGCDYCDGLNAAGTEPIGEYWACKKCFEKEKAKKKEASRESKTSAVTEAQLINITIGRLENIYKAVKDREEELGVDAESLPDAIKYLRKLLSMQPSSGDNDFLKSMGIREAAKKATFTSEDAAEFQKNNEGSNLLLNEDRDSGKTAARKTAAVYKVEKYNEGLWHIKGLTYDNKDVAIYTDNYPDLDTPLSLARGLYETLHEEYQDSGYLREGDILDTPVGQFLCANGRELLPHDEKAKAAIADIEAQYECADCRHDQGDHVPVDGAEAVGEDGYSTVYRECMMDGCGCKQFKKRV